MTETLNQVKDVYEKGNNVTITYNFDSSGTLKTQIQEGADCDPLSRRSKADESALT